ncbi:MAG TPA: hypothetical protein VF989_08650 [Polyangiaceae bacterium]
MAEKQARLMLRVSAKARNKLRRYAVQLTYERDRRVSMTKALDEILLKLPLKKRAA